MGEAGPEAIMPLTRTSGGELGVKAAGGNTTVNVINNSGSQAKVSESQQPGGGREITVLIESTVERGLARGRFDGTMNNAYGIRRKGA